MYYVIADSQNRRSLYVKVTEQHPYNCDYFEFYVINGNWYGSYCSNTIFCKTPTGEYHVMYNCHIVESNSANYLELDYNEVINKPGTLYSAREVKYKTPLVWDDDIPF